MSHTSSEDVETLKTMLRKGPVAIRLVSESMEPVLKVGRTYMLGAPQVDTLKKFDIIVFWTGEVLIAHYIWHINVLISKGTIVTRSLRPGTEDLPLLPEQILGQVAEESIPSWLRFKIVLFALLRAAFFRS